MGSNQHFTFTYQHLIPKVVQQLVYRGIIKIEDQPDITQDLFFFYFTNQSYILQKFDPEQGVTFEFYLKIALRNECLRLIRTVYYQNSNLDAPLLKMPSDAYLNPQTITDFLRQELSHLANILSNFGYKEPEVRLLLQAYYRLPLTIQDFKKYHPELKICEIYQALKILKGGKVQDNQIYKALLPIIYLNAQELPSWHALRIRMARLINRIEDKLNEAHDSPIYNRERLGVLLEWLLSGYVESAQSSFASSYNSKALWRHCSHSIKC